MSKKKDNDKILDSLPLGLFADTASGMDCTGLIPFLPEDNSQLRSYEQIKSYSAESIPEKR